MANTTITRRLEFDAAHRVLHHESKCKHLHGHRYVALVTVTAPGLDALGRVIDFSVVKQIIGSWIDENWDHNIILNSWDDFAKLLGVESWCKKNGRNAYLLDACNPTAEVLARELYQKTHKLLPAPITVIAVRLYETPNCYADFQP